MATETRQASSPATLRQRVHAELRAMGEPVLNVVPTAAATIGKAPADAVLVTDRDGRRFRVLADAAGNVALDEDQSAQAEFPTWRRTKSQHPTLRIALTTILDVGRQS